MRASGGADVFVTARSCSPVYLQLVNTARVTGRLYLPDGSPPPRTVPVELRDADATAGAPEGAVQRTTYSNSEGRFTFDRVEPGRYYLGMNTPYPSTAERPYAPLLSKRWRSRRGVRHRRGRRRAEDRLRLQLAAAVRLGDRGGGAAPATSGVTARGCASAVLAATLPSP